MASVNNGLTKPQDMSRDYAKKIGRNLGKFLKAREISQNTLAEELRRSGLDINQGNISKYLSGTIDIQLSVIVKVCELYGLSLTDLARDDFLLAENDITTSEEAVNETLEHSHAKNAVLYIPQLGSKFISHAKDLDFQGWIQSYYIYFYPTLSYANEILKGRLILEESEKSGVCEARLTLDTDHVREDGTPIKKEYTGCAIISNSVNSMYIILSSEKEGELCMLNMRHFFIRHQKLNCRMVSVMTNSAGEGHVPTMHRALISREQISDEHLALLTPQLHLNSSDILIHRQKLDELKESNPKYAKLIDHLIGEFEPDPMFLFKEDYVRSNAQRYLQVEKQEDKKEVRLFMSAVRNGSYKIRYNKVSNKVDQYVHDLLVSLGYYAKTESRRPTDNMRQNQQ